MLQVLLLAQIAFTVVWFGALFFAYKVSEGKSVYLRRTGVELTKFSLVLSLLGFIYIITR